MTTKTVITGKFNKIVQTADGVYYILDKKELFNVSRMKFKYDSLDESTRMMDKLDQLRQGFVNAGVAYYGVEIG